VKNFIKLIAITLLAAFSFSVFAAASPVGLWKNIDDVTGRPKGIIKVSGGPNNLTGRIVKLLPGAMTICSACSGNLKNKPILGMTVMWGLKQDPSNPTEWSGGSIMDPKNGKTYRCMLTVSPDGRTMEVRGYIGFSAFGTSQTWYRQ
jgi:uncharacterized protein (DUF2147 family)